MISRRGLLGGAMVLGTALGAGTTLTAQAQPQRARQVLAFYYPWYANPQVSGRWFHWRGPNNEAPAQSPTLNTPALGFYDSHDPRIVAIHARDMAAAGITAAVVSWWGEGSFEDEGLAAILDAFHARGIATTVYLEQQKRGAAGAGVDLDYLTARYGAHPGWLREDGRPVFFLYLQALRDLPARDWRRAAQRVNGPEPFLVGDASPRETADFARWAPFLDGIHVYVLAPYIKGMRPDQVSRWTDVTYPAWQRLIAERLFCATVIPGFDDTRVPGRAAPRPTVRRYDGRTYEALWDGATRHDADWVVITSWNEWHEGSEIEPSREYGRQYLDLTRRYAQRFRAS